MIRRSLIAGLTLSALALAACSGPSEAPKATDTVTFSILSTESAQNMESYWGPILADMEKQTGLKVKPFFSSNYSSLIVAMGAKQTDLGWFSNQSGLEAVRRSNGEVFARTFDPSGVDGYKSVIIVPKDSKLTLEALLKCDKSLNFGIGDKKSTSGTLAPMTYVFIPAGKKPETCFKTVLTGNHQANLFAVANGKLDAATNNTTSLRLNAERKDGQAEKVKVIWESPTLPEDPIVWRKDLDPVVKEKLRQFFLTYAQGDTPEAQKQRDNLKRLSIGGFKPADDTHLLTVREMEALETLGLAKEGGDKAKVAAAEKALADIRAQRLAAEAKAGLPAG
ncbi:phosphate/phosphite/phosphonate ABC transporter substrate-binding protein [Caulobacter hibisci]|uniref:Phosphate/phosphite/phosphonate ABC transporter substrate-binding protein n=1 Tax=Caulobacter hibisci TaxID=2035993 RepID=A0ABS0T5D1_9CAUL|nr:phosphate/phosphite/phosphonate ABC transporter substrate-binding protein [Caulobacter hibisci]MBI1686879.1 phosphate/phosphite/phosphonate ABC transporter substrate-binding protein [Caulobacter hibisci]